MANNLFISYDLYKPEQNYEAVAKAIKQLGAWAKVQKSFWYARSTYTATQAAEHVWRSMDANDTLIVVDATNNAAFWYNLSPEASVFLQQSWYRQAA